MSYEAEAPVRSQLAGPGATRGLLRRSDVGRSRL